MRQNYVAYIFILKFLLRDSFIIRLGDKIYRAGPQNEPNIFVGIMSSLVQVFFLLNCIVPLYNDHVCQRLWLSTPGYFLGSLKTASNVNNICVGGWVMK